MSFSEAPHRRMLMSPGAKTKGISRPNPKYLKNTPSRKNLLEKKLSTQSLAVSEIDDNESVSSKASTFFNNVAKIGSTVLRNSRKIFKPSSKNDGGEFFFTNSKNKWRAEKAAVFRCDQDQDNIPTHIEWRGFHFSISQNTLEGRKAMGQDCIGVASHKNWEVFVLCDGHDQDGHKVSQGVCSTLPHYILRRINERKTEFANRPISDDIITEAFEETEEIVCWTNADEVEQGDYVKITEGEFKGETGYVANILDEDETEGEDVKMTIVVDNQIVGYHRVIKSENELRTPRYKGGSTCLCLIRNSQTNKCKVAVLGDSRMMVTGDIGKRYRDEDFVDPALMATYLESGEENETQEESNDAYPPPVQKPSVESKGTLEEMEHMGFFTPQHNVYNSSERDRLKAYQKQMNGEFVVNFEDGYLVNPETKMQIQPTRGFGDVEMQSSGYSHVPQISNNFRLAPNSIIVGASDGIFDGDLWESDEEFLKFIYNKQKEGMDAYQITNSIFVETTKRSKDLSSLDDISLFVYISPEQKKKYKRKQKPKTLKGQNMEQLLKKNQQNRTMRSRRSTIQRVDRPGAHLFRKFFTKNANVLG